MKELRHRRTELLRRWPLGETGGGMETEALAVPLHRQGFSSGEHAREKAYLQADKTLKTCEHSGYD